MLFSISWANKMNDAVIDVLIKQEKQLLDRVDALEILTDLIDDEFIEIGNSGVFHDKAEVIRWLQQEEPAVRVGASFKAKPLSEGLILLTYISFIKNTKDSQDRQVMRSSIWKLGNNRKWRMIFHQGTPLICGDVQK